MDSLSTLHGKIALPTFFPDGTIGVVRAVDSRDLEQAQVEGVVTSTFHHLVHNSQQDLHGLMNWAKVILTDSGGFQVYSLLRDNPKLGKVTEEGFTFRWNGQKILFTPELSIKLQLDLGADILICLDQCTDPQRPQEFQKEAVEITLKWAKRCKAEFERLTKDKKKRPLLFAVIQGGNDKTLRRYCALELIKIGFDGYCYGGVPIDSCKKLLKSILKYTASLMPDDKPKYALGVGKPEDIIICNRFGYTIFDCVIPTREARHKKLYVWKDSKSLKSSFITLSSKYLKDSSPVSKYCDCYTCKNFTKAYLYHLFKIGDTLAYRLATIHNLRFYTQLMGKLTA